MDAPNTYIIIPTVKMIDGALQKTRASDWLSDYYWKMKEDGTLEYAFYDGSAYSEEAFIRMATHSGARFYMVFSTGSSPETIGHFHFSDFHGYCAMIHFNVLRKFHSQGVDAASWSVDYVSRIKRVDDTPLFTSLIGITPSKFTHSLNMIKQVGFSEIDTIDKACYLHYRKRYVDGVLTKVVLNGR